MQDRFKFDRFEVRPTERLLLVDGQPAEVGARAFDLLLCLLRHRNRVVSKGEILDSVWPGLAVEENNLSVQVSALRKVLGSQAIATIPGRGYRFALDLMPCAGSPGQDRRGAGGTGSGSPEEHDSEPGSHRPDPWTPRGQTLGHIVG